MTIGKEKFSDLSAMAARDRPQLAGTGHGRCTKEGDSSRRVEDTRLERESSRKEESSSSSRRSEAATSGKTVKVQEDEEVCWYCRSGGSIKRSHTYRKGWEKAEPDEESDAIVLAGQIQELDVQLGQGATVACIKSQLETWRENEPAKEESEDRAPDTQ